MALLNRKQVLEAPDMKYETVNVPEWGGEIRIRPATAAEADEYENALAVVDRTDAAAMTKALANGKAKLVVKCCVDGDGDRLFADSDAAALGHKNSIPVNRVFQRIVHISGMTRAAREELEKNSGTAPTADSSSSSPGT